MFKIIIVCAFVGLILAKRDSREFPTDIQRCHRGDNECIQNAVQYIVKTYPHGNPALNLPSIDPFHMKKFEIVHEQDDDFHFNMKLKNVESTGFASPNTNYTIKGFEKNIGSSNVTIKIKIPTFTVVGDQHFRLKFKKRPSHGKGRYNVILDDFEFVFHLIPTTFTKNGKEYLKISTLTVDYIPKKVALDFDDLFDGDKDLTDKEHKFLNQHGVDFFDQLRKPIGAGWAEVLTETFDSIFAKYPVDELFLD